MRRHQQSLSKKVCFAWLGRDPDFPQGCTYGKKCAFSHAKDVVCQKWLKGICEHDANSCRYVHHHNPAEVRFEPGTKLCVQCVAPLESVDHMSKSPRPSNIEVQRSAHELEQLDKQLEDINNSIDSETQTRNMLTENHEKAGLILQEASGLVPDIKKLQSDLISAQQRLDDLKEQYEICVTSHHSMMVNFDDNKLQGLLRMKASLLETIESKRKAVRHAAQKKSPSFSSSSPTIGWKQALLDHHITDQAQTSLSLQSDDKTCVVCLDKERTFALNCGHLAYCEDCVYLLKKCAICQQPVEHRQRIHMP